ncbi:MAG: hypothetical protein ACK2T4_10195 [Candidatus Promineifilaceae bacterium]|jgi:uncharacterized membrane protein HdeD (DUF308 family)
MDNARSWWVTLLQGIIAVLLGLYILLGGASAAGNIALVAAVYMLAVGLLALIRGSNDRIGRYRGIVAVIVGAIVLLLYAVDILDTYWDFTIFAVGAILVSLLGLYSEFFDRGKREFSWAKVLVNALLLLWGIMIFFARYQDFNLQTITGIILIVMGIVAAVWGYLTRDKTEAVQEVAPANIQSKADDTKKDATDKES